MALKQIKNKIISTKKTGKVTRAMEAVSAVKMRKSQERAFLSRPYVHASVRILSSLTKSGLLKKHNLVDERSEVSKELVVIVTSDKGLAGSVNSAVLKKVEQLKNSGVDFDVIAIGRKGFDYAVRNKITVIANYTNVSDQIALDEVEEISSSVMSLFADVKKYKKVEIVYQNFISTFEQEPIKRQILPLDMSEVDSILKGIRPKVGKFSDQTNDVVDDVSYTVEPDQEVVFSILIPQLIKVIIFHALLESKASEHSARMVAMKNATDKSKEVVKALTVVYNKARQSAITAEVSEITAGMEAVK